MKHYVFFLLAIVTLASCNGQTKNPVKKQSQLVGGGCDGCELMYVDTPRNIRAVDTSAGWYEDGTKLIITGTVFQLGGKTPAPNVILYYWQTDNTGHYTYKKGMTEKARPHGFIRGWVKTDSAGHYTIHTLRPAPYPDDVSPAHIHLSIKEPDVENEYYTDEINFDDDKLLIPHLKKYPQEKRGGSGIVRVLLQGDLQIAEHDIVLGLNIPNYPKTLAQKNLSGLNIAEDQPSFMPYHAYGPDSGTQTCPVCKYGRYHGIVYFVGNKPDWNDIKSWLTFLERESVKRQRYLKVYFVYGNENNYNKEVRMQEIEQIGKKLNIVHTALTFVPSFTNTATEAHLNKINPEVENTFIIYKHRSIVDKHINLKPTKENFRAISQSLNKTQGLYFNLPEPEHD